MERIFGSGGMPSSHSSTVCAAATVVCRLYGPDSAVFGAYGYNVGNCYV